MNYLLDKLKGKKVILCGIGFQSETIAQYLVNNSITIICFLVNKYTLKPEESYMIPSKRTNFLNSFSEVDMLMDNNINGIPVKRCDMLNPDDLKSVFLYTDAPESLSVHNNIMPIETIQSFHVDMKMIMEINNNAFDGMQVVESFWNINKIMLSKNQMLTNCLKRQLKPTIYDFHFEFHLVEHCNLKCAGCTHFSPLAKESFLSLEEFDSDINRLSELSKGRARFINLLGGEPLLHPKICDFLYITRKAFPDTIVRVVTNGIKIPDMENCFWDACRENNVILGVTQYPINIDYKKIIQTIRTKEVRFESFSGENIPRDEMWRLSLEECGTNRPIENFMRCPRANACVFVKHGKVYNCATMANIEHFNAFFNMNLELSEDDGIDIYKAKDIHEILSFLASPKPFCRFCNIDNRKYGIQWKTSELKKEEWM